MFEITEVRVTRFEEPKNSVKGLATITLDGSFVVRGIQILEHEGKRFVGFPSRRTESEDPEKKYVDIAFPCTREAREYITDEVFKKFDEVE